MAELSVRRPALKYFGGKWSLAKWVIGHLPEHRLYVEPFCGAASVLLRKPASKVEVINDVSSDVVNFFRVARESGGRLLEDLRLTPYAEDEFRACVEASDDPVERARRFFVRSWQGFSGGSCPRSHRGFRRYHGRSIAGEFKGAVENVAALTERLRAVTIENLDWSVVLEKYDRLDAVFYVDPPYLQRVRAEGRYDKGYGVHEMADGESHMRLIDRLEGLRGAVVLSGYADPMYDLRLAGWERQEKRVSGLQNRGRTEVLWIKRGTA
tara:strand:+ start:3763 stop:4563 length:801 start_codon:yes stop_codon:yes gene_type:complete